ncbi:uncharacterized protein LOC133186110 [Saccostrea echinata]|uniref:uncharacterized protein LOC133186110 n=1 Tax=Saccostrea echinata TaxID=191078 RepID=UPI002A80A5E0|nr:uncharacterized protein LOC133186110 [Saccostrea echinata]
MSKSILNEDCQRFFRVGILILKHGTALLQVLLDLQLHQLHVSLRELLTQYHHKLFHSWQKSACCACPTQKASYFSGCLLKEQYEDLFVFVSKHGRDCRNIKSSVHGLCSCRYEAINDVTSRSLDIIITSMLLLNLESFHFDNDVREAISELRRLRNEIVAKGSTMSFTEGEFILFWNRAIPSMTKIAKEISDQCLKQTVEDIRVLKDEPLHLYSAMVVITTIRHGNQREISFLKDLEHAQVLLGDRRQGELLPMLEFGLEVVCSTLGLSDPALKEMQNSKFLLHNGKIPDLIKKLSSPWMKKLINARLLVQEQTEIWREDLWSSDPLRSKTNSNLGFISCGQNIRMSNDRRSAIWNFIESEGVTFSNRAMEHLEHVQLEITGSGEVAIGVVESDPMIQKQQLSSFSTYSEFKTAIVVKTFESSSLVKLFRNSDELVICFDKQRYVLYIERGQKMWLVFYLRFGDVKIELHSSANHAMKFHDVMGSNVQATGGNKRLLSLKHVNPRSVCRLSRRIHCGEEVTVCIRQEKPTDVHAIPCYILIGISADGLQNGSLHDDQPFTSASRSWLIRKKLDEPVCFGKIQVSMSFSGVLTFVTSKSVTATVQLSESERKMGVAVVFELFRTELEIANYKIKR